ncbi:Hypothetical predicted protein [Cloeon dipterum]|uniref:C2H2-type domain-containing protein n=1 Tax=Cloeon dipterum TaxID=197152 RepID=A0A8S1DB18_9INSE|nr:Hypothetical predicted protein [Cloeon dipterum]
MSIQKALCLICERPTADGAVSAVHVDKEKLQTWFLNVCESELEEIEDDDLICYYCLWHAEGARPASEAANAEAGRVGRLCVQRALSTERLSDLNLRERLDEVRFQHSQLDLSKCKLEGELATLAELIERVQIAAEKCHEPLQLSGDCGLSVMSFQKDLCLICEFPTADGAIFAVHVDKERLQEWFLNVCGHELAEEILDEDKICYFCAWQAEFLWNFDGMSDDDLVWWPRSLDYDDAAKELRKHYFEGIVEQCWVQLEEVNLPDSEEDETEKEEAESESETHSNLFSEKKKCLYCGKLFKFSKLLSQHVKQTHKENIRCENLEAFQLA